MPVKSATLLFGFAALLKEAGFFGASERSDQPSHVLHPRCLPKAKTRRVRDVFGMCSGRTRGVLGKRGATILSCNVCKGGRENCVINVKQKT